MREKPLQPGDIVHLLSNIDIRPMVVKSILPDKTIACQWFDRDVNDCFGKYDDAVLGKVILQYLNNLRVVWIEYSDGSFVELKEYMMRTPPIIQLQCAPMTQLEWDTMMGDTIRMPPGANWNEMSAGFNLQRV